MASTPAPSTPPCALAVRLDPGGAVVCDPRLPFLRADDLGVLRGDGVFERFLVYGDRPRHLEDHLARLARSAAMTGLEIPAVAAWRAAVSSATAAWTGPDEWEMRLVCTRGPEEGGPPVAYVLAQELAASLLRQRTEGVAVVTVERGLASGLSQDAPWLLLGAKTLSYAVNMAVKRWAAAQGADDAVFVGQGGEVWEAGTSAVVVAFGRRLVSPPASVGILDSISVDHLFTSAAAAHWATERVRLNLDDLYRADGLWLSSSLRFVQVHTIDGKSLPPAPAHAELAALAAAS
ncbi:MAG TPA: aminotransferase class IV [Acidimicrobiales bacterium]|nr:aminotransferase class IV [Acidimicrobiales bacterium]